MKVNTNALASAEGEFDSYRMNLAEICDSVASVASAVTMMKGIDGVRHKLIKICGNLEETQNVLSEMSSLLEMAAEIYNRTEETVINRNSRSGKNAAPFFPGGFIPEDIPRRIELIDLNPDSWIKRNTGFVMPKPFVEIRKNYLSKAFVGFDNNPVKNYSIHLNLGKESVISAIGRIQEDKI